jgi:ABC-type spermidine/putrescine transport system permease subunit II
MFRFLLKLNLIGRMIANLALLGFLCLLFLPLLTGLGLWGHPSDHELTFRHLITILANPIRSALIWSLFYSLAFALFCSLSGLLLGFYTRSYFTGRALLMSVLAFFILIPPSLNFLASLPLLGLVFSSKNYLALTYGGGITWGLAVAVLLSQAFFRRVSKAEIESATTLGANPMQLIMQYILPRARSLVIHLTTFLCCNFLAQGLYTVHNISEKSPTFFFALTGPMQLYQDPGPGAIAYTLLLITSLVGVFAVVRYCGFEFKGSGSVEAVFAKKVKTGRKKVTRKKQKKKKAKKPDKNEAINAENEGNKA